MKNIDELYENYYNAYESDYDNDDELTKVKKKKLDYKLFKLFDKTYERLKLDGEKKHFLRRLKIEKRVLIKRYYRNILAMNLLR